MRHLSVGQDRFYFGSSVIDVEVNHTEKTYSPTGSKFFKLARKKVKSEDVQKQDIEKMPGFGFSWYYSRIDVERIPQYSSNDFTKIFVRNYSFISYQTSKYLHHRCNLSTPYKIHLTT